MLWNTIQRPQVYAMTVVNESRQLLLMALLCQMPWQPPVDRVKPLPSFKDPFTPRLLPRPRDQRSVDVRRLVQNLLLSHFFESLWRRSSNVDQWDLNVDVAQCYWRPDKKETKLESTGRSQELCLWVASRAPKVRDSRRRGEWDALVHHSIGGRGHGPHGPVSGYACCWTRQSLQRWRLP